MPALPLPCRRMRWPSRVPALMRNSTVSVRVTVPSPWQLAQSFEDFPVPLQLGQVMGFAEGSTHPAGYAGPLQLCSFFRAARGFSAAPACERVDRVREATSGRSSPSSQSWTTRHLSRRPDRKSRSGDRMS